MAFKGTGSIYLPVGFYVMVLPRHRRQFGAPDLRGRFILGAGPVINNRTNTYTGDGAEAYPSGATEVYIVNQKGGSQKHQLTEGQMPSHMDIRNENRLL